MFCVEGLENSYCFIYFKCLVVFTILTTSSTLNVLPMVAMMKLDGTNYQKWKKMLVMNMSFMKLDLALEMDPPEKPIDESSATVITHPKGITIHACIYTQRHTCM